jgi:hypothetical protein
MLYFFSFPLQQWLYELASILRYTFIACLVYYIGDYKRFSAGIWEQYSDEQNTLCNMYLMKIHLLIYFCLGPSLRNVLENNTSVGMVMTVWPMVMTVCPTFLLVVWS